MEDAQALTPDSDFKPFMARGVSAEVKNAAMKKLFSDPHFNVMDGLDTYIGDYSQPDPIPESMLRQLASAKFLDLFDERKDEEARLVKEAEQTREPKQARETTEASEATEATDAKEPAAAAHSDTPSREVADKQVSQSMAQSYETRDIANPAQPDPASPPEPAAPSHADPDLRLQPDDAAPGRDPRRGAS